MQAEINIPNTLDEVTGRVVSIVAQSYMRYRKGRQLPPIPRIRMETITYQEIQEGAMRHRHFPYQYTQRP
ncbi:hypothetical protein B2D07_04820 [Desulfococcus multivorans]|jgi:hypothetical protein|uniref:Uncharacterized protein n=1 Tax=Desulfococcus multivorans DSM 2059 TaxID=1121405 RepID=S7TNT4_DESML|nr:hypothetical protein [Desulfococcus multivorans]AOY57774.1 uncharacterized protein Dmul_09990 [Desulfococcus multivorans]AQV00160.1 hypothetical protein B2D07_04820 [Desulfococcus multivorans]EPR38857.1 hypothetical protein dsmv_0267 [Desulfococcus multivorans DSM 2059]SKA28065.1 hypothetical protein SAMN02745446_03755 [Desulfococcus multivorans DSM 2059]